MHRKRTTAPDGIRGVIGPPPERPVKGNEPRERLTPAMAARVALELARERRRLSHRPTMAQLRTMARFGGRAPSSYRLDRAVNWLPESLPLEFPHGAASASPTRAETSWCCRTAAGSRS
jgi:hypothetical protein